jgi:hypothetical protein
MIMTPETECQDNKFAKRDKSTKTWGICSEGNKNIADGRIKHL